MEIDEVHNAGDKTNNMVLDMSIEQIEVEDEKEEENNEKNEVEAMYRKHREKAEVVKKEYEKAYKKLTGKLRSSHLEPFAKILDANEGCVLYTNELIEGIRNKLLCQLLDLINYVWDEFSVNDNLTTLEALKEEYQDHEGTDWGILEKTPEERCLYYNIYIKRCMITSLEKQIKAQTLNLDEVLSINQQHRMKIQRVIQNRAYSKQLIDNYIKKYPEKVAVIKELQEKFLDLISEM